MEKAKDTLRDVVTYADEVLRDERLRADIRTAVAHGSKASHRVKRGIAADGITTHLVSDKRLRKDLRGLLDGLESASARIHRTKDHRARNVLVVVASAGAVLAAIPNVRHWLAQRTSELMSGSRQGDTTADRAASLA
jgi:hypothetical protein